MTLLTPPPPHDRPDPHITVLPHISAPIDGGRLLPAPPQSAWQRLLLAAIAIGLAAGGLAFAFVHATRLS